MNEQPRYLVDLLYLGTDTPVYVTTHYKDVVFGGNTYKGVGAMGQLSSVKQSTDGSNEAVKFALSGIPTDGGYDFREIAEYQDYRWKPATVTWVWLNDSWTVIDSKQHIAGFIESMETIIAETVTVSGMIVAGQEGYTTARTRYLSNEDQQSLYPGDLGCELDYQMEDMTLTWGFVGG